MIGLVARIASWAIAHPFDGFSRRFAASHPFWHFFNFVVWIAKVSHAMRRATRNVPRAREYWPVLFSILDWRAARAAFECRNATDERFAEGALPSGDIFLASGVVWCGLPWGLSIGDLKAHIAKEWPVGSRCRGDSIECLLGKESSAKSGGVDDASFVLMAWAVVTSAASGAEGLCWCSNVTLTRSVWLGASGRRP